MIEENFDRISTTKNSVARGLCPGKNIPYALKTNGTSVYRVTGLDQIEDIVNCGYVRAKDYGVRREKFGDKIYWSIGGENLYYSDKRPVIEAPITKVIDGQMGAIPIEDLTGVWFFDEIQNKYINKINQIKKLYEQLQLSQNKNERKIS